jgi:hypothetical protein
LTTEHNQASRILALIKKEESGSQKNCEPEEPGLTAAPLKVEE